MSRGVLERTLTLLIGTVWSVYWYEIPSELLVSFQHFFR